MSNSVSIAKKTETKKHPTNKPTIATATARVRINQMEKTIFLVAVSTLSGIKHIHC